MCRPNVSAWLTDEKGRDMFALRYGSETEIATYDGPEYYDDSHPFQGWAVDYFNAVLTKSNIPKVKYTRVREQGFRIEVDSSRDGRRSWDQ